MVQPMSKPAPIRPPPTAYQLEQTASLWQQLRQGIVVDDELFVPDEDMIEQMIEAAGREPPRVLLARLIDATVLVEQKEAALDNLRKRYSTRRDRYAARAEKLRGTVNQLMELLGETAAEGDLGSASYVRARAKVVITDMTKLPEEYIKRTDPEPKKLEIASAIKGGKDVPGAEMSTGNEPPSLRIVAY